MSVFCQHCYTQLGSTSQHKQIYTDTHRSKHINADANGCYWLLIDKHRANSVQCVAGSNLSQDASSSWTFIRSRMTTFFQGKT